MSKPIRIFIIMPVTVVLLFVLTILFVNYLRDSPIERSSLEDIPTKPYALNPQQLKNASQRLSEALRIQTVSRHITRSDNALAKAFQTFLRNSYPLLHKRLKRVVINENSFIYHWSALREISETGSSPVAEKTSRLKPVLLLAHYDVVPAEGKGWRHPPFSGFNDGKAIWGRGSLDDKSALLAMLEAIELLLAQGMEPQRDVYLAVGHDEELGGEQGAKKIAQYFTDRNVQFEMIIDEGLLVTDGVISFVSRPVALIGLAEKGLMNIELSLVAKGGHASMPGNQTAVVQMARAITRLETRPLASRLTAPISLMLARLRTETTGLTRLGLSNLWLFRSSVIKQLNQSASTHAAVNTTVVATQLKAAAKINVLPTRVTAKLNIRLLPGDTIKKVQTHIRNTINDEMIQVKRLKGAFEPAPVSALDSSGYRQLEKTIRHIYPDAIIAPGLVLAATDSRHYQGLANDIYRFRPLKLTKQDLSRFHGKNERILIDDYHRAIRFYRQILLRLAARE